MIRLGYVHMLPFDDTGAYAYVSSRMPWKFWRWKIVAIHLGVEDRVIATNLTKLGAIGMLKLLGATK